MSSKRSVALIAFLLVANQAYGDPVPATNPQLLSARAHMHQQASKLDAMTEDQWKETQASRGRSPDKIIPLFSAQQQIHAKADELDATTDSDWNARQKQAGQSLQGMGKFLSAHGNTMTPADMNTLAGQAKGQ